MIPTALRAQPSRKNEIIDYFYGMSFYFYFYYCCLLLFFFFGSFIVVWTIYVVILDIFYYFYLGFFFKVLRIIFGKLRIFLLNLNS